MKKSENAWKEQDIFDLFKLVENNRRENKALVKAFEKYAKISGRKKNSVRNFYYKKLKEFEQDTESVKKYKINLSVHTKNEQKFFTPEEAELSIRKIEDLLKKGYSVRKACYEVASGDVKQMLRLQNKFRSTKQKISDYLSLDKSNKRTFSGDSKTSNSNNDNKSNLLIMPNTKTVLTDSEINSLFMGLVKLVKKVAKEQCDLDLINQMQSANAELRRSIKSLADKEREIKYFRKKFDLLTNEKTKLKEELNCLRSQNAELLKIDDSPIKFNKLKNYIDKLGKKTKAKETT
ncbi:MAG: hypothetical protein PHX09_00955 [Clostridia bacterium]|nr:hypothetical protein [Clostridia bacterium]MDD4685818.1 hypothetical protein [Clostridia bacterium]